MISFAVLMLRFSPWLVLILFATSIPAFIAETRFSEQGFRLLTRRAPETRQINYLARLLTEDSAAKEIKLFNLGDKLLERYTTLFAKFFAEDKSLAVRRAAVGFSLGLIATLGFYGSYAWIVWRTVQGTISLGDMTLYLTLFRQGQTTFQSILAAVSNIYENNLFMANYFEFLGMEPQMRVAARRKNCLRCWRGGIEFRGVGFRYPESEEWVLRGVDLFIRPGEKIALVGHNGAGKTTLIKLLSRLYDPTEGVDPARRHRCPRDRSAGAAAKNRRDFPRLRALSFAGAARISDSARSKRRIRWRRSSKRRAKAALDSIIEDLTRRLSRPCSAAGFTAATSFRSDNGSASRSRARLCAMPKFLVLGRAYRIGGRANRIRDLPALSGIDGREDGDPDLPSLLDRAHGRSHRRHRRRTHYRNGQPSRAAAPGRHIRAAVQHAGGRVSVRNR